MASRDLRLLSLDGGGVRGLSSLSILKKLMEIIDPDSPPKPCEYFDMIGGTSTGGLMAIMLGRLEMDIDECISAYMELSDRIFQKSRHRVTIKGKIQGRFDAAELERSVKKVVVQNGLQEDTLLKASDNERCKVFICATSKETGDIVRFTTYPPRGAAHLFNRTRIWEAARATSAASSFFDPIKIGPYNEEFVDGATGANNPVQELWNEAKFVWLDRQIESSIQCLVSIGTGIPSLNPFGSNLKEIAGTLVKIATETESTAETFHRGHSELDDGNRYFRFNVTRGLEEIGLEDTSQKNLIMAATSRYVESEAVLRQMKICGKKLSTKEYDGLYKINFSMRGWSLVKTFVARDKELEAMEQALLPRQNRDMHRKIFILHGLGGVGKTQLAIEFARKYQKTYSSIFWLNGASKDQVRQSLAEIAQWLPEGQISDSSRTIAQLSNKDLDIIIEKVQNWFSQPANNRWLLIYDNVDRDYSSNTLSEQYDPHAFDLEDYFPSGDHGSILVTSRLRTLSQYGVSLGLSKMDDRQGKALLKTRIERPPEGLERIVHLLDGLPLALAHAGSYLQETGITVDDYITAYESTWKALFDSEITSLKEYPNRSVQSTWTLSYEHVKKRDPDAAKLLNLWAYLDASDVWYELFLWIIPLQVTKEALLPAWFMLNILDKSTFTQRIRSLLKYSLVEGKTDASAYSMHPVVHEWCFRTMTENRDEVAHLAVMVVGSACPGPTDPESWVWQRRLLPHCERILQWCQSDLQWCQSDLNGVQIDALDISLGHSFFSLGMLVGQQNKLKDAEFLYQLALRLHEKTLGLEHDRTQVILANLVQLFLLQNKSNEAEETLRRAMEGSKTLGSENTHRLRNFNILGTLLQKQGKLSEAKVILLETLDGYEKVSRLEDPYALETLNNLGLVYRAQGNLKDAEKIHQRALRGFEKVRGPEHLYTMNIVNNLGYLYVDQGNLEEAGKMFERVLRVYEKAHRLESRSTLITFRVLGIIYREQGKLKEAEEMMLRALKGFEKAHGAEHSDTVNTARDLEDMQKERTLPKAGFFGKLRRMRDHSSST